MTYSDLLKFTDVFTFSKFGNIVLGNSEDPIQIKKNIYMIHIKHLPMRIEMKRKPLYIRGVL